MHQSTLTSLLNGTWTHPDTNTQPKLATTSILIEKGLAADPLQCLRNLALGKKILLVSDTNLYPIIGKSIEQKLAEEYEVTAHIVPGDVSSDINFAYSLHVFTGGFDAVVAVGSGTLNDLCKFASYKRKIPYVIFSTAPSMNGYASATASLTLYGRAMSKQAHAPCGIFLDTEILANAPMELIQAGLCDTLCRSTVQADWLLSHHALGTPYDSTTFNLLNTVEDTLIKNADKLANRDPETISLLAHALIFSGIGMQLDHSSNPASQGEHMLAHTMHLLNPELPRHFHGQEIAVTTLTMAALQEKLLSHNAPVINTRPAYMEQLASAFTDETRDACRQAYEQKPHTEEQLNALQDRLNQHWPTIRESIHAITLPAETLRDALRAAGAPTTPSDLDWHEDIYTKAVNHAHFTRDRFTFLDLYYLQHSNIL